MTATSSLYSIMSKADLNRYREQICKMYGEPKKWSWCGREGIGKNMFRQSHLEDKGLWQTEHGAPLESRRLSSGSMIKVSEKLFLSTRG